MATNKDETKDVSKYNISEFMIYVNEQYDLTLNTRTIEYYIHFLEGFCVSFPMPEKFEQIINVLRDFKLLLEIIDRYTGRK